MNIETILFIIGAAAFFYACLIEIPLNNIKLISLLKKGDQLPNGLDIQAIEKALRMAVWIRGQEEIKVQDVDPESGSGTISIVCKKVIYQILVKQNEAGARCLTVEPVFRKRLEAIDKVSYILEADRIRYYILEHAAPIFAKGPQTFYAAIQNMFRFRYTIFGIVGWILSYPIITGAIQFISKKDPIGILYTACAAAFSGIFICFGQALPNYIKRCRREKLLNGISVPKYLDNDALMELIQTKLRIKTVRSIYFDEAGSIAIKGKCGTYTAAISPEMPKLFVNVQQNGNAKECLEADYIRCSIMKLFDSAHPENPEEMRHLFTVVRRGILIAYLSFLGGIILVASAFLTEHFESNGIADSYLTKYSETVTVGEAFEDFFSDPEWESYKIGSKEYVDFTGGCTYLDEPAVMTITFICLDESFRISNIAVDGVDMPVLLWAGFLETIYDG